MIRNLLWSWNPLNQKLNQYTCLNLIHNIFIAIIFKALILLHLVVKVCLSSDSRFCRNEALRYKQSSIQASSHISSFGRKVILIALYFLCVFKFIPITLTLRAGVRLHVRGADPLGNSANFIETEQIIEYEKPEMPHSLTHSQQHPQHSRKFITSLVQVN